MNFIIVDLEATCLKERDENFISEIIEIGAVKLNSCGETLEEFNCFVKPTINPILSDFCTELTSITQEDVDNGLRRKDALSMFQEFCGDNCMILSWGGYDRNQLKKEFERFHLPTQILNNHINLKVEFSKVIGATKQYGMARALNITKIPLDGTHHRGIDDAKNISKIFVKYLDKWSFIG